MITPLRAVLAAALLCVLGGLLVPASANAARNNAVQVALPGHGFTATPAGPLLDVSALVPGAGTAAVIGVRSGSTADQELLLRFVAIHDEDNGCTPPEAAVDRTCGTGGGDLGSALRFAVAVAGTPDGPYTPTWAGTAADLARGVDAGTGVHRGADRWVRLSAVLPGTAGNVVQSDTFDFRLRVELATASQIDAVTIGPAGAASEGAGPLALTGAPALLLIAGGLLLVVAGAMLYRASVSRAAGSSTARRGPRPASPR